MFKSKTVFIVGAGASHEVGLPVGEGLKVQIAERLTLNAVDEFRHALSDREIENAIIRYCSQNRIRLEPFFEAAKTISDTMPITKSIDTFLNSFRGDEVIEICAKLAIARSIIEAERYSELRHDTITNSAPDFKLISKTWFAQFNKLLCDEIRPENLDTIFNNVSFISFNYDRCIEHFLFHALKVHFRLDFVTTMQLMKRLVILHPYGQVGPLDYANNSSVPFGSSNYNLLNLVPQIKTFSERLKDSDGLTKIREEIESAEILVFLGFAYHEQNLNLLAPLNRALKRRIYGTACGVSQTDTDFVHSRLISLFPVKKGIEIQLRNNLRCEELFTEFGRHMIS